MKIVTVDNVTIVDRTHSRRRGGSATRVSMRVAERVNENVLLFGLQDPRSGGPTVVAYLDAGRGDPYAWLDPESGKFLVTYGSVPPFLIAAMGIVFMVAVAAMAMQVAAQALPWLMGIYFVLGITAMLHRQWFDRRLEAVLRAALTTAPTLNPAHTPQA